MTFSALAVVTLTFVLAGFVKGVIGLGLPTVAMGLLAVVMTPAQAAALLVAPSFLTNVWQAMGPELAPLTRRLWPMLLGICVGVWAGGGLLTADSGARASIGLRRPNTASGRTSIRKCRIRAGARPRKNSSGATSAGRRSSSTAMANTSPICTKGWSRSDSGLERSRAQRPVNAPD